MKIAAGRVGGFLDAPSKGFSACLVFGPNTGLAHDYAAQITKRIVADPADAFAVTVLTGDAIANDPALLFDAMKSASLFGSGRQIVRVEDADDQIAKHCAELFAAPSPADNYLLLLADELEAKGKLRQFAEESAVMAVLGCYAEEGQTLAGTIRKLLADAGLTIGGDALALLQMLAPPDRLMLRSEIEKLALYCHGQAEVTLADVRAVASDAGVAEEYDLPWDIADGNAQAADRAIARLYDEGTAPVGLLRLVQTHFSRLEQASGRMSEGASASDAVSALRPPLFRLRQEQFQRQLGRWPHAKVSQALQRLLQAEALCKKTGTPDKALAARTLLQIAQAASSGAGRR